MKKYILLSAIALASTLSLNAAGTEMKEIITEAPAGETIKYYADFQNYDNTFGFMGDYHSEQKIVFCEDGSVYFPNLLLRRTMPAYVKGEYDREARTITVEPGQWVFYFPNVEIPVALYTLDSEGLAGPSNDEFYSNPLVFDVAENGVITLRESVEFPMFGLCNALDSEIVYANAKDLRFTPVDNITDDRIVKFSSTYVQGRDTSETTARGYRESDDIVWVQGLDPHYPESWIKVERYGADFIVNSFQVMMYFSSEDPVVAAALNGNQDALYAMKIDLDETTLEMTIGSPEAMLGNITPDQGGSYDIYQVYSSIHLMPAVMALSEPAKPEFVDYRVVNSIETEFIFDAYPVNTEGTLLPSTDLYFIMYVDGEAYTFTLADYRWINEDMAMVPYNFYNYNFFSYGGDDNQRRYVYFQNLPSDVESLGVELVYITGEGIATSERLTYNISTGDTSAVREIEAGEAAGETVYYNLQGMPVKNPVAGEVYIRVSGNKTTKVISR